MKFTSKFRLALLATIGTATMIQPVMALDAQAFVDRVAAVYGAMGYDIEPGTVEADGATVVVKGVKIAVSGEAPTDIAADLTFTGVTENADGSYTADALTMPDFEYDITEKTPGHVSLKNIVVNGIYVPAGDGVNFIASLQGFASASAGPLSVTRNGLEVITVEKIGTANVFNPAQGSADLVDVASSFELTGFSADLSTVAEENAEAGAVIEALGLTQVSGNINESMTWNMADGHMVIDQFLINLDDQGAAMFNADLTGLTPALMDTIYASAAAAGDDSKTQEQIDQANMMMGMQVMSSVSINSARLRFDDASMAMKLINFFAAQENIEPAQLVAGLKQMVPAMINNVGIPALNDILVPAVNAFLDDPQSLEVALDPPSPVNGMMAMGAAANPAGLIPLLGVSATANQPAK
ncbi:hypothetical protein PSQ90_04495 [Devosia rhodophyticola]|uniref:DUF945 domain-containing protein n=1 Tax=Devosia rhodophyticola TaxID=3026423 RepID=A0ABY7YZN9_9HYPH|nr:hypothetical protein [Devosia rhodophyticola]WDR06721.1 hypothetical protein PSQ90_04495 [Devosia rhodophyticola]